MADGVDSTNGHVPLRTSTQPELCHGQKFSVHGHWIFLMILGKCGLICVNGIIFFFLFSFSFVYDAHMWGEGRWKRSGRGEAVLVHIWP